jgi:hypothetical protein
MAVTTTILIFSQYITPLLTLLTIAPHHHPLSSFFIFKAFREALACDQALTNGEAPPALSVRGALWGVPVVVKECFEVGEILRRGWQDIITYPTTNHKFSVHSKS